MQTTINQAAKVLNDGGIILYPTDTIWGIGCDATNPQAVARVYALKQRTDSKSMIVLIDSIGRIASYVADAPDIAYDLMELSDTPLTIVFEKAKNLAPNAVAPDGSIAIRVVQHDFCQRLIGKLRKPIISTSANISGKPFPKSFEEIDEAIKNGVDFVVPPQFHVPVSDKPSSIIAVGSGGLIKVIRE